MYSFLWYLFCYQALSWILHLGFSCENRTGNIPWRDVSLHEKEQKKVWSIVLKKKSTDQNNLKYIKIILNYDLKFLFMLCLTIS